MSKTSKALGATAALASGPSGIKRLFAGGLVIVLLGGLALGGLLAFATWSAKNSGNETTALPCPPSLVGMAWSTRDIPTDAREVVEKAIRASGRKPVDAGWGSSAQRDLVVVWSPGTDMTASTVDAPVKLTLGAIPTAAEVRTALGARLAACGATPTPGATVAPEEPPAPAQSRPGGFSWPWKQGWNPTSVLGFTIGAWWLAGPNLARAVWRAFWPVRLGWRLAQRWAWRRGLLRGVLPVDWPLRPSPGQRWHENDQAMHDRRPFRQQIAEGEPERRAALRKSIREERLAGTGFGPAPLWRHIYRTPAPERAGAPKKEEVLP